MRLLFVLALVLSPVANAEETYITMPNENWTLKLETPPITNIEMKTRNRIIRYLGSSVETGVTISVNSEIETSSNNEECFKAFWAKAQANPVMVKSTIKTRNDTKAYYATHQSGGEYKGQAFKTANGHAYFAKDGICIDLHVSHWPFTGTSESIVSSILESIEIIE
ncbi:MAG: hypothetical protein OER98_03640 [Gammaproteobacteria bacterium]|nr:hypothetical protein [Gammaproteobacteria bacterium]